MTRVLDVPLYERSAELKQLELALNMDPVSHGSILQVIEGPAGIGKTSLLRECRRLARERGWLVLHGCGLELERRFSFGIVRQLFEAFLGEQSPGEFERVTAGAASDAARLVTGAVEAQSGDGSFALLHGLTCLVTNIAATRRLLIQVDDLQWVDEASLRWLVFLLPRIEGIAIGFTGTLRREATGAAAEELVRCITSDPRVTLVRPAPLSSSSVAALLREALSDEPDAEFVDACHMETGGNPFLIREVVIWLRAEGIRPTSANTARLRVVGGIAVAGRVAARLAGVPPEAVAFARALAVLGDGADLHHLSALAGSTCEAAAAAVDVLQRADLVRLQPPVGFVHPVVRTAVYESIPLPERVALHARAASVLEARGAAVDRIATQLLHAPPGSAFAIETLRRAASDAMHRGASTDACTYLARCEEESLEPDDLFEVLMMHGIIAQRVDLAAAIGSLTKAMSLTTDRRRRADAAWFLATSYLYAGRVDEAIALLDDTIDGASDAERDARQRAQATRLLITALIPGRLRLLDDLPELRAEPVGDGFGGRSLSSSIALREAFSCEPAAVDRARQALDGGDADPAAFVISASPAWHVLIAADADDALPHIEHAITARRKHGGLAALAVAYSFRALCWLHRGRLSEAEADGRYAQQLLNASSVHLGRPIAGAYLAEALIDQGKLDEAGEALDWGDGAEAHDHGRSSRWYGVLCMRARLARQSGNPALAVELATASGRLYSAHGADNPAISAWRSELALALLDLDEEEQAREHAAHELALAERWGAPRALGRALRIHAATLDPAERGPSLTTAIRLLKGSPAALEFAWALADQGAGLLAGGDRLEARDVLRRAYAIAQERGAHPLARRIRGDLRTAGARPPRDDLSGPDALTPSERKVAELAASGATNREIAEALFVTHKTVELHLTSVYRKLRVGSRADLSGALAT